MRILHTADWHLGQHFMDRTRQAEHQAFCTWLIEQVREYQVDVVVIAGDVFHIGAPPSYAREQYYEVIVGLRSTGCTLVVLGGNHDSVATLNESKALLEQLGTRVIASVCEDLQEQLLVLNTRDGKPGAILCAVPFIRPRDVLTSRAGMDGQQKQQSLQHAIQQHYADLFALAETRRNELGGHLPIIATGHLTTVGASASESVREIYVGSLEAFPTNDFPPAAYIALGHIHKPQKVGGLEHIRYCGSPIPLSFDEATQQKEVLLIDLDATGLHQITALPVPCFQPMMSLCGSLKNLESAITNAAEQGTEQLPVWLDVTVVIDDYLNDLPVRIGALCEGLPVEVLRIHPKRSKADVGIVGQAQKTLNELSPADVFDQRLASENLEEADLKSLRNLYQQVVRQLRENEA